MLPTPNSLSADSVARALAQPRRLALAILIAGPLALVGCRDPKVTTYDVPKEAIAELPASAPIASANAPAPAEMAAPTGNPVGMPAPTGPAAADPHAMQTAAGAGLTWTAPADWQSKQGSAMRKATYVIGASGAAPAELAITAFPGDVGGEVANVNRWRGQVGLSPLADGEARAAIQRLEANGLKIGIVDVADPSASTAGRLVGAMVPYAGATWFFKLLGPDAVVTAAKPAFVEFLKTVKPAAANTP